MDLAKTLASINEKATPYIKKAEELGLKTLDFTSEQLAKTPLFIKSEDEWNEHITQKRAIVVAYDESDKQVTEMLYLFPLWGTKAWMDAASLKFLSWKEASSLAKTLQITGPIEMRVYFGGELTYQYNNPSDIKEWWDIRCYTKEDKKNTSDTQVSDPLSM